MALPPEPIAELLPLAEQVLVATVLEILTTGPTPLPSPGAENAEFGATSVGNRSAVQSVRLKVERVLKGNAKVGEELVVSKPEAPYLLRPGNRGPFLVNRRSEIIGRYGPDTYSLAKLEAALSPPKAP